MSFARKRVGGSLVTLFVLSSAGANANVTLNRLFSEGAVLQQGKKVAVWGTGNEGEKVIVRMNGQTAAAVAKGGKWMAFLRPMKAGGPYTLTVQGENSLEVKNVMVGEVFICSGQSNMEWPLSLTHNATEAIAESTDPMVRMFTVQKAVSDTPVADVNGSWEEANPQAVPHFSAVGYHFARALRKALGVPVGMIHTSWGGTPAESWTKREVLEANPDLKGMLAAYDQDKKNFPAQQAAYQEAMKKHEEAVKAAQAEGKTPPKAPDAPGNPVNAWRTTTLYNAMIAPLVPYGLRGAIWYQGESNAGRAYQYRTLFPAMISNWRADFLQGDFPFYFVQLAPWQKIVNEPVESDWAELREAQLLTTKTLKNTGMAVITDLGDEADIHPRRKQPVGERLAMVARAQIFGQKVEFSGPAYDSMEVKDGKAVLHFKHLGGGLSTSPNGEPNHSSEVQGFTIAGADHKFYNAVAKIEGNTVVVSCPSVPAPVAVRYGWANYPVVNLFNKAGLPASPFRTDDFPMVTKPR